MEEGESEINKSVDHSEVFESSDSDADSLQIAIESETTPKRKKSKPPEFDSRKLDKTIEETIQKCENITPDAAKKMLLKLIKNEHVLALALLKAEEQEKQEHGSKSSDSDEDDKKSENEAPATPKLTRLKAKQMNHKLPMPGALKSTEPCEDVIALIQDELKSDDEDDEYEPCEDEILSDEDVTNTTFSDIESQPSTPGSALYYNEQDFESPTKDYGFKVPKTRSLSIEEQENISRRTRSKLCLMTTPIETIESTFVPPDITKDMYDFDQDHEIDNEWKEFLEEFMMPLTNVEEDDEKSDPEYVAAEKVPLDKEELRPVNVSKKELNQLIAELLEDSTSLNFDSEPSTSTSSFKRTSSENQFMKSKRQRVSSPTRSSRLSQSPKISSRYYSTQELLSTPPQTPNTFSPATVVSSAVKKDVSSTPQLDTSLTPFYQQQLQTPQRVGYSTPTLAQSPAIYYSPAPMNFTPTQPNTMMVTTETANVSQMATAPIQAPMYFVMNSQNQLELVSQNILHQPIMNNGMVQFSQLQSVVMLENQLNLSAVPAPQAPENVPNAPIASSTDIVAENLDDNVNQQKNRKNKLKEFEYLETQPPPDDKYADSDHQGFTYEQKQIYEQQMQMHAQLLSQHFLQLYANAKWWEKAEPMKQNLMELEKVVNPLISPHTVTHIKNCLELCNGWEKELEENNDRNKKYSEFLYEECELDQEAMSNKQQFKGRFSNRLMEYMLSSTAIMYPKLLPRTPFRCVTFRKVEPPNSELMLVALGIQRCYNELYEKIQKNKVTRQKEPTLGSIVKCFIEKFKSFRNQNSTLKMIEAYRNHAKMNPIKYYYMHKKAPEVIHKIENVNPAKVVTPKQLRRGLLPKNWDVYMFSQDRLDIHPYEPIEETPLSVVDVTDENTLIEEEEIIATTSEPVEPPECNTITIDNTYKIEIIYDQQDDQIPKINICHLPYIEEQFVPEKVSCISLISPVKVREKSAEEKQKNLISILKKVSDKKLVNSPVKKKSVNFALPPASPTPPERTSPRFAAKLKSLPIVNSFVLTQKFFIVIESFFTNYNKEFKFINKSQPLLKRVFYWTKTIDIYSKLLQKSVMIASKKPAVGAIDNSAKPKKTIPSGEEYSKKLHRKLTENRSLIMHNDRNKCTIEKDCSYAYNYLESVKKTLSENGDEELYTEFMAMLTAFDPESESVPELYQKIESLLMPNYSDLVDLFLTFLLPEHAAELGKFFEHFVLTNMKDLLLRLNFFFNKQPSHMKRIYTCLSELSTESDLTMDRLRVKVLPLLKGNQLLIDWFMQLFEKPHDGLPIEYESVYIKKSLSDSESSVDNYEEIHSKDLVDCDNNDEMNTCGVRYQNGKVRYHGTLLPAKISFLAHDAPSLSSTKKDENSLCVHDIRQNIKFSDTKTEDCATDECSKKLKKTKKYKLCDAQTLHAHAVRLNPVHAHHGEKLSDLTHLLSPPNHQFTSLEEKNSPKKIKNLKKSGNSPKKSMNKSPSSSSGNSASFSPPTQSPSKALQTAKKLRTLIDEGSEEPSKKKMKVVDIPESSVTKPPEIPKVVVLVKAAEKVVKKPPAKPLETPTTSKSTEMETKDKTEAKSTGKEERRGAGDWTRDEDKIILEEVQAGHCNKEKLVEALLKKKLLLRDRTEINDRYEFLIDIIMMRKELEAKK